MIDNGYRKLICDFTGDEDYTEDILCNHNTIYSDEKKKVFVIKDTGNRFVFISQEFWDDEDNTPSQKEVLRLLKDVDEDIWGWADIFKIFLPEAEMKNMVSKTSPIITSPESVQTIGNKLLKGEAGSDEFKLTYIQ